LKEHKADHFLHIGVRTTVSGAARVTFLKGRLC